MNIILVRGHASFGPVLAVRVSVSQNFGDRLQVAHCILSVIIPDESDIAGFPLDLSGLRPVHGPVDQVEGFFGLLIEWRVRGTIWVQVGCKVDAGIEASTSVTTSTVAYHR